MLALLPEASLKDITTETQLWHYFPSYPTTFIRIKIPDKNISLDAITLEQLSILIYLIALFFRYPFPKC